MAVSDWSTTADDNTTIDGLDIGEDCSPANINNAIRSVMAGVRAKCDDLDTEDGKALKLAGGTMTGEIKSSASPVMGCANSGDTLRIHGGNDFDKSARIALQSAQDGGNGSFTVSSTKTDGTFAHMDLQGRADTGVLTWNGRRLPVKRAEVYNETVALTQATAKTITITPAADRTEHLGFIITKAWPGSTWANAGVQIVREDSTTQIVVLSVSSTQNYTLIIDEIYI